MYEGGKVSARWFGKPDTFGWEIYPNMFERRKLWSILNGRLRKREPVFAKQRALGAASNDRYPAISANRANVSIFKFY